MSDIPPPTLSIAPELQLPLQSVTETFGVVGVRGSGKTATAGVITEEMVTAGAHVVVIDPTGAWWGLRSNAAGDGPGLPVYILGGDHADLPLSPTSGVIVAGLVVQRRYSVVLDLSRMDDDEQVQFLADFCGELYLHNRQPIHLVCDEAQIVAPQTPERGPHQVRLRKAIGHIVQRGRIRGIGVTLITQRPALVSKNVWTQVETLICLRMTGSQDLEAVDAWIRANSSLEQRQEMLSSLPGLETGHAWVWSPLLLGRFERVQIRRRRTFDSSRTPRVGEVLQQPEQLAAVDLEALRAEISATITAAESEDPTTLKAEIARLQAEVEELRNQPAAAPERVEVPVIPPGLTSQLTQIGTALQREAAGVQQFLQYLSGLKEGRVLEQMDWAGLAITTPAEAPTSEPTPTPDPSPAPPPAPVVSEPLPVRQVKPAEKPAPRPRPQSAEGDILRAIAQFAALGMRAVDRRHVAIFSGQSPTSSTYDRKVKALRDAGFLEYPQPGMLALTERGRNYTGNTQKPASADALRTAWLRWLNDGEAAVLRPLIQAYPRAMTRADLARASRQSYTSSAFDKKIKTLKDLGLADYPIPGAVVATALLFPDRKR